MKIVEQLSENRFVIELEEEDKQYPKVTTVSVVHDYLALTTLGTISCAKGVSIKSGNGTSNSLSFSIRTQTSIRGVYDIILPFLNNHKYLQPKHFANREGKDEDGVPYKYPAYCYLPSIIRYWDEDKGVMYAIRAKGESEWNHVTEKFYKTFIEKDEGCID